MFLYGPVTSNGLNSDNLVPLTTLNIKCLKMNPQRAN